MGSSTGWNFTFASWNILHSASLWQDKFSQSGPQTGHPHFEHRCDVSMNAWHPKHWQAVSDLGPYANGASLKIKSPGFRSSLATA